MKIKVSKIPARRFLAIVVSLAVVASVLSSGITQAVTSSTSTLPDYLERSWYVTDNNGGVAVDGAGNVYITRGASGVIVLDNNTASTTNPTNPTTLKEWTGFGAGDITIDEDGMVYVTDGNTVKQFDGSEPSGAPTILKTWTGFNFAWGIDIDEDGDIVVANYNGGGSYRMFNRSEPEGAVATTNWTGVNDAWTVTLDDEGNVYAAGYGGSISKFSKTEDAGTPASMTTWSNTGGNYINGIHWADDYVYISPSNLTGVGSFQRFPSDTAAGDIGAARVVIGGASTPYSVATDTAGNVYGNAYGTLSVAKYIRSQNLGELTIPDTSDLLNITLPQGNHITSHSVAAPTTEDDAYEYPLGLVSFTFSTSSGSTVPVQITFQTDLAPEDVVPRKYNSIAETYEDIPDAEVTATTVGGQPALLLEYEITDGGPLDEDEIENGVIVDPVALGTATSSEPEDGEGGPGGSSGSGESSESGTDGSGNGNLADTGQPVFMYFLLGLAMILLTILISRRTSRLDS